MRARAAVNAPVSIRLAYEPLATWSEITPMVAVVAVRRPRALRLGRYWSSAAAVWTRLVASREMRISTERPLRMYDAVVTETPALTATSDNVDLRRLDIVASPRSWGHQQAPSFGNRRCWSRFGSVA